MNFVTCGTMKNLEKRADENGLSYYQMMENAGTEAAKSIMAESEPGLVAIMCGKGNNGGDGYVVARLLDKAGYQVIVIMVDGQPVTKDAITNYQLIEDSNISIYDMTKGAVLTEFRQMPSIIVDAIYGTGFKGQLKGNGLSAAMYINKYHEKGSSVFALDIPSGLAGDMLEKDSHMKEPNAVVADVTITFHARKPIHMQQFAQSHCGKIVVADIGIDEKALLNEGKNKE